MPTLDLPNLDAMEESDLRACADHLAEVERIARAACAYARAKLVAMQCRRDGRTAVAMEYEAECDAWYAKLPQEARW